MKKFAVLVGGEDSADFVHPPGHGGFGHAEDFGGLGMGQLLAGNQHRGVAERRFQAGDGALQPDGVVGVGTFGLFGNAGQHCEAIGEGAERAASSPPISAGVEGDAVEPGGEPSLAAIAANLLDQRAADILRDVVGIGARTGQLPGEAVDAVIMAVEQRGECVAVAGASGGDETGIRIAVDFRPLRPAASS